MKRVSLFLVLSFIIFKSSSQNIELSGGINRSSFYDRTADEGHFHSQYTFGRGYSAGLSISDLKIVSVPIRVSLLLDNYRGTLYTKDGGNGGSSETVADVEKTVIGLGLYPLNFTCLEEIKFSFGGEFNYMIDNNTKGYKSSSSSAAGGYYMTIENDSVKINQNFAWGLSGRMAVNIKINENWMIAPYAKIYIGVRSEFKNTQATIHSLRQNFGISIIRVIKKNEAVKK